MRTKDAGTSGRPDAVSLLAGAGCKHFPGVDRNQQELHFFQAKVDHIFPVHNAKKNIKQMSSLFTFILARKVSMLDTAVWNTAEGRSYHTWGREGSGRGREVEDGGGEKEGERMMRGNG